MVRKSNYRGERWGRILNGTTESTDHKRWAGDLARNNQDVTAVVNRIEVLDPDIWDYQPAVTGLQEVVMKLFKEHLAVLKEPEPWVLVHELASSTINIQFFFWVDGSKNNMLKVKSSLMRLIKSAYLSEGISMPDGASERILLLAENVRRFRAGRFSCLQNHAQTFPDYEA